MVGEYLRLRGEIALPSISKLLSAAIYVPTGIVCVYAAAVRQANKRKRSDDEEDVDDDDDDEEEDDAEDDFEDEDE